MSISCREIRLIPVKLRLQGDAYNAFTIATTVVNNKIYSVDKYLNVFIDGVKQYSIKDGTVNPDNILHKYASIVVSGGDIYVSVSVDILNKLLKAEKPD